MRRSRHAPARHVLQSITWIETVSREYRPRRMPLVTDQELGVPYLADGEGASRQRSGFRFRWLPPSAVQTCIDGDRQAGIQIHSPFHYQSAFALIASFHVGTVACVRRSDHRAEVPYPPVKGPLAPDGLWAVWTPRSLSDIDLSTAVNDLRPSASFSARKNPQCIPVNTPPVFSGLRPCNWPHLLRLVTNGNVRQAPCWAERGVS
jgi:hypothetical protein